MPWQRTQVPPPTPDPTTVYQRYDAIYAIEGPWPPGLVRGVLTKSGNAGGRLEAPGGPYRNIPFEQIRGNVVLVSSRSITVHVFNGQAHLKQKLTGVYKAAGTITQPELEQLQKGEDFIVDWFGQIEATQLLGGGTRDFLEGRAILVREAPNEPAEERFELVRIRDWGRSISADPVDGCRVFRVLSNQIGRIVKFEGMEEKGHEPFVCSYVVDSSGEIVEGFSPDGCLVNHMSRHDHVVVAVRDDEGKSFSTVGSKVEMLTKVATMPVAADLRQQAVDAIEHFDPSAGILYVIIENGQCDVRRVPWEELKRFCE